MLRRSLVRALPAGAAMGLAATFGAWPLTSNAGARVVRFGQSASLSGGQAAYGQDVRTGIAAAFAAASAQESTTGLRFELATLDDGGVRAKCMKNVMALAESDVLGVIGLTSGAGAEACLPVIEDAKLPMIGTASGNMGIRAASVRSAFHVRAGYDAEYKRIVGYAKDFGMQRVGLVYLGDTSKANLDAMTRALAEVGIVPKVALAIDRNAASFDSTANELLAAKLDCVLFTANAEPVSKIIDLMTRAKFPGLYYASSFAGQDLIDKLVARQQTCVMSVVVPRPSAMGVNVVSQCKRDLALLKNDARLGVTTLEGYIAGRIAVDAALAAQRSGNLSRGRLFESLAALRSDLGGYRVDFAGSGLQGSHFVDLIAVDRYGRLIG